MTSDRGNFSRKRHPLKCVLHHRYGSRRLLATRLPDAVHALSRGDAEPACRDHGLSPKIRVSGEAKGWSSRTLAKW
jgi:hypothetical protein